MQLFLNDDYMYYKVWLLVLCGAYSQKSYLHKDYCMFGFKGDAVKL